jgi:hypothetical protein
VAIAPIAFEIVVHHGEPPSLPREPPIDSHGILLCLATIYLQTMRR